MRQFADVISIRTNGRGLIEVTASVAAWIERHALVPGMVLVLCSSPLLNGRALRRDEKSRTG